MEVFIFTVASSVIGGSHLNRMQVLDKKLKTNGLESHVFTNLNNFRNQVKSNKGEFLIILDVPTSYNEDLSFLINPKIMVVGYEYSGSLILDYNIVPFLSKFREFYAKKEIYSGLKYLIIRDEIVQQKKISHAEIDGILITLGAGNTKRNALDLRKRILSQDKGLKVKIIVGKFSNQLTFFRSYVKKNPNNFAEQVGSSKIVFTNGGSTLVESIFLHKNIVCWPQTQFEYEFAKYLSKMYHFQIINGINDLKMISQVPKINIEGEIDGRGADRVFSLLCDIIDK